MLFKQRQQVIELEVSGPNQFVDFETQTSINDDEVTGVYIEPMQNKMDCTLGVEINNDEVLPLNYPTAFITVQGSIPWNKCIHEFREVARGSVARFMFQDVERPGIVYPYKVKIVLVTRVYPGAPPPIPQKTKIQVLSFFCPLNTRVEHDFAIRNEYDEVTGIYLKRDATPLMNNIEDSEIGLVIGNQEVIPFGFQASFLSPSNMSGKNEVVYPFRATGKGSPSKITFLNLANNTSEYNMNIVLECKKNNQ